MSLRQAQLFGDGADFVLEQKAQRLDQLQVHVFGQAADIVMRLDLGRALGARFDHVRVERALRQKRRVGQFAGLFLEDAHELFADDLALALRVGDARPDASRNRSSALIVIRLMLKAAAKRRWTSSASPFRSRPWLTKMQVS